MNPTVDGLVLDAAETRVLGSLVEKQITTPDYYPLSLNALVNACSQSSNRDPVVAYSEAAVTRALESLRDKKLVFVFEGAANRVAKYGHKLTETLDLSPPATAALCVLLLRGPQTVGEIRGRTGRLHAFASLGEVEATLQALAARAPQPLAVRLPRQAGCKESRYAHLLSGPPAIGRTDAVSSPEAPPAAKPAEDDPRTRLEQEVARLRDDVAALKVELDELKRRLA